MNQKDPIGLPDEPKDILTDAFDVPYKSPVQAAQLTLEDTIRFHCHKGIACFNECCRSIDITLMPYDIVRLKRRLKMASSEFVNQHSVPFEMDHHGMPGLKLSTKPGTSECVFLTEEGCGVYADRPAACRYYALGSMGVRKKDADTVEDVYFVVKEPHCLGHQEPRELTVAAYREEQGIVVYDEINNEWRDLVIKKRSAGPTIGKPSQRSFQLFDMCSYDIDSFRRFMASKGFKDVFDLSEAEHEELANDEDLLLQFAMRFMRQVFFGEMTIPFKEDARELRVSQRKERMRERRSAEVSAHKSTDVRYDE